MAGLLTIGDVHEAFGWRCPTTPLQIRIEGDNRVFTTHRLGLIPDRSEGILMARERQTPGWTIGDAYEAFGKRCPTAPLQIRIEGDDRVFMANHHAWDHDLSEDILVVRDRAAPSWVDEAAGRASRLTSVAA